MRPSLRVQFLAGDASLRRYYRFSYNGLQSRILMEAPPPESPQQYVLVGEILRRMGLSSPEIYSQNLKEGFLVIEDLGDHTFTALLSNGHEAEPLYRLAVDTLIEIHQHVKEAPAGIPEYSLDLLLGETQLFIDWYWPAIKGFPISSSLKEEYQFLWTCALEAALQSPRTLVLRDFHVDNLMYLKDREGVRACGLLDFQDATWGPLSYDLVSLLEDARRDVDPLLTQKMWKRYLAAFPHLDEKQTRHAATVLSAGRHAKIIGIFTRLAVRDQKPRYLSFIPRVWRLLEQCLQDTSLSDIRGWLDYHLPERKVPC